MDENWAGLNFQQQNGNKKDHSVNIIITEDCYNSHTQQLVTPN